MTPLRAPQKQSRPAIQLRHLVPAVTGFVVVLLLARVLPSYAGKWLPSLAASEAEAFSPDWLLVAGMILLLPVLRVAYSLSERRVPPSAKPELVRRFSETDGEILVVTTAASSMILAVGTLVPEAGGRVLPLQSVGILLAALLLGSVAGLAGALRLRERLRGERWWMPALPVAVFVVAAGLTGEWMSIPGRAAVLFLAGLAFASAIPLAALRMHEEGDTADTAGKRVTRLTVLGAMAGGLIALSALLPAFGMSGTVLLAELLAAQNLAVLLIHRHRARRFPVGDAFERYWPPTGYILFAVGAGLMAWSTLQSVKDEAARNARRTTRAAQVAQFPVRVPLGDTPLAGMAESLTGRTDGQLRTLPATDEFAPAPYAWLPATDRHEGGFVYCTAHFVQGIDGFNGPVVMAVWLSPEGVLRGLRILEHDETPAYLAMTDNWRAKLIGLHLFDASRLDKVDTVSGATYSSMGILQTLFESAARLRHERPPVMTEPKAPEPILSASPSPSTTRPDAGLIALCGLLVCSLYLRVRPNRWARRGVLLATVITLGFWLNVQYSTYHVLSVAGGGIPPFAFNSVFALAILLPVMLLLTGNLYCGYLCPFGALQELLSDMVPRRWHLIPDAKSYRSVRTLKYLLLFGAVTVYALTRSAELVSLDPLVSAFAYPAGTLSVAILVLLAVNLIVPRFWCRALCPTGAFLSLANRVRLLRRWLPAIRPADCDLGVRTRNDTDCIQCDRCRGKPE